MCGYELGSDVKHQPPTNYNKTLDKEQHLNYFSSLLAVD